MLPLAHGPSFWPKPTPESATSVTVNVIVNEMLLVNVWLNIRQCAVAYIILKVKKMLDHSPSPAVYLNTVTLVTVTV